MPEEKTAVETSENKKDWAESEAPALPDLTDETETGEETGEVSDQTPAETETKEESVETKTETPEAENIETEQLDETELLKKYGLEDFADKGGIEAALKDYQQGRKGFTQDRQETKKIEKILSDFGITGEGKLSHLVEEAVKKATTPQIEPSEKAYQDFLKEYNLTEEQAQEANYSKSWFKLIRKITGAEELQHQNEQVMGAFSAFLPLLHDKWYGELSSQRQAKGQKILASVEELTAIINSDPRILERAGQSKNNPMNEAYGRWIVENKGEELLGAVFEAGKKKQEEQNKKIENARKVEKPGGKGTLTGKRWQEMSQDEFDRLPLTEKEKIVKTPEFQKKLTSAFQSAF